MTTPIEVRTVAAFYESIGDHRACGLLHSLVDQIDALTVEREALCTGLADAIESVKSWGAYASPYFRDKWDLDADIKRLQTLLKGEKP